MAETCPGEALRLCVLALARLGHGPLGGTPRAALQGSQCQHAASCLQIHALVLLPCSVRVRNVYFEDTPLELLAGVVTEAGPLDGVGIERALAARLEQFRTAFQLD